MKPAIVLMMLLGCDCDARTCEYISAAPVQWHSMEACQMAIDSQIGMKTSEYPLITARCMIQEDQASPELVQEEDSTLKYYVVSTKNYILKVRGLISGIIDGPVADSDGKIF